MIQAKTQRRQESGQQAEAVPTRLIGDLRTTPKLINDAFKDIEKLEKDLWEAADNLRANSKLTSSDYFMPVLGVIFLRHAANRFNAARNQIEADQASGKMPKRKVLAADYIARRSLYL